MFRLVLIWSKPFRPMMAATYYCKQKRKTITKYRSMILLPCFQLFGDHSFYLPMAFCPLFAFTILVIYHYIPKFSRSSHALFQFQFLVHWEQRKPNILRFYWKCFSNKHQSIFLWTNLFFVFHDKLWLMWSSRGQGHNDNGSTIGCLSKCWNKQRQNCKPILKLQIFLNIANPYSNPY